MRTVSCRCGVFRAAVDTLAFRVTAVLVDLDLLQNGSFGRDATNVVVVVVVFVVIRYSKY